MHIKQAINELLASQDLTESLAEAVMEEIMSGQATAAQIGGFLIALRLKGETAVEVTGLTRAMRRNCIPVRCRRQNLVDTCGTGGDGRGTFNISTAAAFVAAGAGLAIAKHGNRSVSSKCGSADVLQALGVRLDLEPQKVATCIDQVGIGFLFAPLLHPAMKHIVGPRREMGVRTVFNILGPLANPAGAQVQILGVYDQALVLMMARVLNALGSCSAYIVHSADGLDELSTTGPNQVAQLEDGQVRTFTLDPIELGLPRAKLDDLVGGDAEDNAALIRQVLDGELGPRRDIVLLNAAAALAAGGLAADLRSGLDMAAHSIDSGAAREKLAAMVAFTNNGARA
ncbi:MAG: anthranilate phosphoribosyltransferase [Anaerolineales bacterium]|nr:anthranilate phosphoribosyltransferase [Anaerolineales bacterium]